MFQQTNSARKLSHASAEAARAIASFHNTTVRKGKKGPLLWLKSLSLLFLSPTRFHNLTSPPTLTLFCVPHRLALLFTPNCFCLGTSQLRGGTALKVRHLRMLGYDGVLVRRR